MARAKRTDRAAARRRYRAQLAQEAELEAPEGPDAPTESTRRPAAVARPTAPTRRVGMGEAFRSSFRQANYREDIAFLPRLVLHPAVWGPVLITLGASAVVIATRGTEPISILLAQYFVIPPPIAAIFIAGFFAPRASYLAGAIVGLVAAVAFGTLAAATPTIGTTGTPTASPSPSAAVSSAAPSSSGASAGASSTVAPSPEASPGGSASATSPTSAAPSVQASPGPSGTPSGTSTPVRVDPGTALAEALVISPLSGVFFGAATAWYRRWLRAMNPNAGRRPAQKRGQTRRR